LWKIVKNKYTKKRVVKMKLTSKHLAIVAIVAVAAVVVYYIGAFLTGRATEVGNYDDLAKCLTDKGAVMYGSKYCGHCENQKELFGNSFQYITYVECTEQTQLCQENGVRAVPAWKINGELHVGFKSLDELALMVGC
jgi:glutaredoxin